MSRTGKSIDGKQIRGCQGLGEGERRVTANGAAVSFGGDENVLELDRGDDGTTLRIS